ncbi:MAG: PhoH family protein [Paludibacteraceae bacterium]|jgi:PhoH-like ATPase|nr:PhoH family protein [Paludibacteraceae bacterium]
MGAKKNFVLDTNVILHDHKCIYNFEENDIYIPIVVLEELDRFKKGNEQINFAARQFAREIDLIADSDLFSTGASLGEGKGRLFIVTEESYPEVLKRAFSDRTPDHRILAVAITLAQTKSEKTILVTKDINLRMKAKSLGVLTEDYINDKVTNMDIFEKEFSTYDVVDPSLIDKLYSSNEGISLSDLSLESDVEANECFLLKSSRASVMCRYNPFENKVRRVEKQRTFGIEPRNAEQTFAMDVLLDDDVKLVAITGRAGTGKTLLALAAALYKNEEYKQILLSRPIVALGGKDLGALPGDATEKVSPYMQPLFDNLNVIKSNLSYQGREVRIIEEMQRDKRLVIEALAFIRGRSLGDTFFIVDEAQNLTPHEVKTIVTRAGEGSKIIFTGDIQQIDSPYLDHQSNGLVYLIDRMKGQDIFAHVNLIKGERSYLSELASKLL